MRIETLRIRNFRALRDVTLADLPGFCVFVGANGPGKSTLFDVLGFLHDALLHNVRHTLAIRGGFKDVVSRGSEGPIEFELKLRQGSGPLVSYQLVVSHQEGTPVVERELLQYRRGPPERLCSLLDFKQEERREEQKLESPDILAIKGLGQFQRLQQVSAFRRMIEDWHVSDFHISAARPSQEAGLAEHLSRTQGLFRGAGPR